MSHDINDCMFSVIDNFIECLDGIKGSLDDIFVSLEKSTQEQINNIIINEINPTINQKLADLRSSLISSLQSMYAGYQKLLEKIQPISDANPTDLSKVITFCNKVKDFITDMYSTVLQFITILTEHILRLNNAISSLVAYTPPLSGFDFSALDIQMESISMSDITGGA